MVNPSSSNSSSSQRFDAELVTPAAQGPGKRNRVGSDDENPSKKRRLNETASPAKDVYKDAWFQITLPRYAERMATLLRTILDPQLTSSTMQDPFVGQRQLWGIITEYAVALPLSELVLAEIKKRQDRGDFENAGAFNGRSHESVHECAERYINQAKVKGCDESDPELFLKAIAGVRPGGPEWSWSTWANTSRCPNGHDPHIWWVLSAIREIVENGALTASTVTKTDSPPTVLTQRILDAARKAQEKGEFDQAGSHYYSVAWNASINRAKDEDETVLQIVERYLQAAGSQETPELLLKAIGEYQCTLGESTAFWKEIPQNPTSVDPKIKWAASFIRKIAEDGEGEGKASSSSSSSSSTTTAL